MLDPRIRLDPLGCSYAQLQQQPITVAPFQPLPTALGLAAVQMSRKCRVMTNRPPSVHSPEYASQHQIFVFLLILLLADDLASCWHLHDFSRKDSQIPDRYLQKRICEREMFQGWTSSSAPNIFPDMLTVCCAMQENLDLGSMSSVRMGLTVLLQTSALHNLPF